MNSSTLLILSVLFLQLVIHKYTGNPVKLPVVPERNKRILPWIPALSLCHTEGKCAGANPFKCYECSAGGSECFPASAKVILDDGKSVTMSDLQIGDKVQTVASDGKITYSKVKVFVEKQYNMNSRYKAITTAWNKTISLSRNHLIYGRKRSTDKFQPVYADQVSVGDQILAEGNDEMIPRKVLNVSYFMEQGAFVPLTIQGNIIVNGVLASCYASFDHDLAYIAMTPMQLFPEVMGWIVGEDNGSPGYGKMAKVFGKWMLPAGQFLNVIENI